MSGTDSLPLFPVSQAPDYSLELKLIQAGNALVAGVDEVGRGPLAGPVTAAAVILDETRIPKGLNDSKKLTEKRREALFAEILLTSHVAWCSLPADAIDRMNIREATLQAMTQAVLALPVKADAVLVDGRDVPKALTSFGQAAIKGDAHSVSIAAASIVAKVIRDRMMVAADTAYPAYGFTGHKGYGSAKHRAVISDLGPCPLHRRSFAPLRQMVEASELPEKDGHKKGR